MIIDGHAHITPGMHGAVGTGSTRSLPYGRAQHGDQVVQLLPPLSAERTAIEPETMLRLMDWTGVEKMVLMQGPFFGDQNTFLYQAAKKWPERFAATAFLDPLAPTVRDQFRRVTEEFGFRVLTFDLSEPTGLTGLYPDLKIAGEEMAWILEQAERLELTVSLNLGTVGSRAYQTEEVATVVQRYPRLQLVIAHLAHPPLANPVDRRANELWLEQIDLGKHLNVWFDTSGLPAIGVEDYPYPTAMRYIRRAAGRIGADKLMWGSDIPAMLCHATYPQLITMFALHSGLNDHQVEKILGATADQVYFRAS